MKKVIVVGAGASGLMAAYAAAVNGNNVTVLEKNEKAGKKIYITGKGRCNVTNDISPDDFFENVVHNSKFLRSCIYKFTPQNLIGFLESGGLPLKIERGNRVFPNSDKASDVTKCLETYCLKKNVEFVFNQNVTAIEKRDDRFLVVTPNNQYTSDAVIISTGGLSYPGTGSSGDGYRFAQNFGIRIIQPRPALCGICCDMSDLKSLQGLSLKNVKLSALYCNKEIKSFFGEMLFTHFGISGPIALSLSSVINDKDLSKVSLVLDLKPAIDDSVLDKRILRDFQKYINRQISHALNDLLPKAIIVPVLSQGKISLQTKANEITKEQRIALISSIKKFKIKPISLRSISESIITAGGVDVTEINPKTMESKNISGLYFCGEVLDVDAFTGGFNLQIAFSTGYAAGSAI